MRLSLNLDSWDLWIFWIIVQSFNPKNPLIPRIQIQTESPRQIFNNKITTTTQKKPKRDGGLIRAQIDQTLL